ncbi:hypothetical protein Tco_0398791, partial [Tanacetum coccineum]
FATEIVGVVELAERRPKTIDGTHEGITGVENKDQLSGEFYASDNQIQDHLVHSSYAYQPIKL